MNELTKLGIALLIIVAIIFAGILFTKWESYHATSYHQKRNNKTKK